MKMIAPPSTILGSSASAIYLWPTKLTMLMNFYFQSVEDIFSAIKERQLSLLKEVLATEGEGEARFISLLNALQRVYEENRIYLKPLVIDYHSSMFSRAYRQMLKDALKRDGNFPVYPEDSREYIILDSVMSGYIEMLLQLLDSGSLSMEASFRLSHYTMEYGTKPALQSQLGIRVFNSQHQI